MIVIVKSGNEVRSTSRFADFSFDQDSGWLSLIRPHHVDGEKEIDTKKNDVAIYASWEDVAHSMPAFEWKSDATKEAEAAREAAERAEKDRLSRADVLKPRYVDPLAELEATIRKWCMHRGANQEGDWFRVNIESGYKKKILTVVMLLDRDEFSPMYRYFEGESTGEMFHEALMFYRKGCEV